MDSDNTKKYLKTLGVRCTIKNIEIIEDIQDWSGYDKPEDALLAFYNKVRWEGTSYFFENYTSAFDHWTKTQRKGALEMAQKVKQGVNKEEKIHSLREKAGCCRKCNKLVDLDEEIELAFKRWGFSVSRDEKSMVREDRKKDITSGQYTCERCIF